MVFRKILNQFRMMAWFLMNVVCSVTLPDIGRKSFDNSFFINALSRANRKDSFSLYLNQTGIKLSYIKKILFHLCGNKLFFVLETDSREVAGICFFYFNYRDIKERGLHLAYIGIAPRFCGRKLGTFISSYVCEHYSNSKGLMRLSTRVSLSNIKSLTVKRKVGYKIVEQYFDYGQNENRVYMVKELKEK